MKRILSICTATLLSLSASAFAGGKDYIIVLHSPNGIAASVEKAIQDAGGTITIRVPELGALGVQSDNPNFVATMQANKSVEEINDDVQYQLIPTPEQMNVMPAPADAVSSPGPDTQTGPDPFYNPYQWDKKRIRASNQGSYAVQLGRHDVVVAVLDTGAQILPNPHPDLQANLDTARSRSFVAPAPAGGDPAPSAWDDRNGHGTHCATSIGAPINHIGIVGVAPNVTLVALKVLRDSGSGSFLWLAEALVYAGVNKFDVASMSLSGIVDHATNQATIKLVQRAVNFARENGVLPVAALGNSNFDVSDGDFFRNYIVIPAELDGVVGVSATNFSNNKASYSNYGTGKTDVSAPGGDVDIAPPFGFVLAGWAPDNTTPGLIGANYVFAAGTSMACPQVAGVAALIISQYGDFSTNGNGQKIHMSPQQVESILQQTANNQPCPAATTCDGGDGYNNYFGKGIVDALRAVTQ